MTEKSYVITPERPTRVSYMYLSRLNENRVPYVEIYIVCFYITLKSSKVATLFRFYQKETSVSNNQICPGRIRRIVILPHGVYPCDKRYVRGVFGLRFSDIYKIVIIPSLRSHYDGNMS